MALTAKNFEGIKRNRGKNAGEALQGGELKRTGMMRGTLADPGGHATVSDCLHLFSGYPKREIERRARIPVSVFKFLPM